MDRGYHGSRAVDGVDLHTIAFNQVAGGENDRVVREPGRPGLAVRELDLTASVVERDHHDTAETEKGIDVAAGRVGSTVRGGQAWRPRQEQEQLRQQRRDDELGPPGGAEKTGHETAEAADSQHEE